MARTPVAGPVVIPSCAQILLNFTSAGRIMRVILHSSYTLTGPTAATFAETLFAGIKAQAGTTAWMATVSPNLSFTGVWFKDLRFANQVMLTSTGAAMPGTGTGVELPLNVAECVTLRTNSSGRAFRGRSYLPGILDSQLLDARTFTAASGTLAVGFLNGISNVLATNSMGLVVAQRALNAGTDKKGNPLPARAAATVPVTAVNIANPRVDSQRRRLGR